LKGFLDWQLKELQSDKRAICSKLRAFGYSPCLHVHATEQQDESMTAVEQWTTAMDEQLVQFVNQLWESSGVDVAHLVPSCLCMRNDRRTAEQWPLLASLSLHQLHERFALLLLFNQTLLECAALIDFTDTYDTRSLAARLFALRHLIFYDTKSSLLYSNLRRSAIDIESVTIYLSRLQARSAEDSEHAAASSLFLQTMMQLNALGEKQTE
jgi:hypothetical protein